MAPASSVMTSKMEPSVMRPMRSRLVRRSASSSVLRRLKMSRIPISLETGAAWAQFERARDGVGVAATALTKEAVGASWWMRPSRM